MKLYFVRHGESEANVLRVISNRGWRHPLTEKGRCQAHDLADRLCEAGIRRIYTSPLQRAVQTAQILAKTLGIEVEISDGLREFDCGIAEGRSDAEAWALHAWVWQEWALHQRWDSRIECGESFNDMRSRFLPLIEALVSDHAGSADNFVLVGHGALFINMLPLVLANLPPNYESPFPNTGYVLAEARPEGLICLEWCGIKL